MCVCVCCRCAFMHAFLCSSPARPCPRYCTAWTHKHKLRREGHCMYSRLTQGHTEERQGGTDLWASLKLSVSTAAQYTVRLRIYWPNSIITSCWVVVHTDLFINGVSAMHLISAAAATAAVGLQLSRYCCVSEMLSPWLHWHRLNASLTKSPLSDFQNTLKS